MAFCPIGHRSEFLKCMMGQAVPSCLRCPRPNDSEFCCRSGNKLGKHSEHPLPRSSERLHAGGENTFCVTQLNLQLCFTNILNVSLEFLLRSAVERRHQSLRLCSSSLLLLSSLLKSSSLSTYLYVRWHNNLSLSCLIDPCEVIQHREATCQGLLSQRTPSLGRSEGGVGDGGGGRAVSDLTHSSPESQCLLFGGEETKHKPSDELPYEPPSVGCS